MPEGLQFLLPPRKCRLQVSLLADGYPHDMATEKSLVTAYVLARLAEMEHTRGAVAEALRRGGLARTAASVLRNGSSGVGPSREPGWARALGYATVQELRDAAYQHARTMQAHPLTDAQREAIAQAMPLGQLTQAEGEAIVRAAAPQYADRPAGWWLSYVLAEYKYLRERRTEEQRTEAYQAQVRAERERASQPPPAPTVPATRRRVG